MRVDRQRVREHAQSERESERERAREGGREGGRERENGGKRRSRRKPSSAGGAPLDVPKLAVQLSVARPIAMSLVVWRRQQGVGAEHTHTYLLDRPCIHQDTASAAHNANQLAQRLKPSRAV